MESERYEYQQEYPQIYEFPGKSKSAVWKDFGFYKSAETGGLDKSNAVCRICLALVKYCGNTTNLHTHLAKHRPKQYANMRTYKFDEVVIANLEDSNVSQDGIIDSSRCSPNSEVVTGTVTCGVPTSSYPTVQTILMNSNHVQSMNSSVAEYLISGLLPPSHVDNAAFRTMMRAADQGYSVPASRYFMESLIPQYYNDIKTKIQKRLKDAENATLSTDIWTSNVNDSDFMTLNVHLIDATWTPHSFTLSTLELDDDTERLSDIIQTNLDETWGIPVSSILMTNSDARVKSATDILGIQNIFCLGSAISMAADDVLSSEGIPAILEKCRMFIKCLNRNKSEKVRFRRMQEDKDDLELDIAEKWTTTFDMLRKICKNIEVIEKLPETEGLSAKIKSSAPSSEQLKTIKTIKDVLGPLRTAAKIISDQGLSTASMILPVLRKLEVTLAVKDEDYDLCTSDLKRRILCVLSSLYQDADVRQCLLVSSLLDPRYKDLLFVEADERKKCRETLAEEATVLYRSNNAEDNIQKIKQELSIKQEPGLETNHTTGVNGLDMYVTVQEPSPKRHKAEPEVLEDDDWLADVVKSETKSVKSSAEESVLAEIDRYMSAAQTSTPPLQWWKNREAMYPILSRLVKKYLCVLATNEQYEKTTSPDKYHKTWTYQRAMLPSECVDKLVFLNKNMSKCNVPNDPRR